MSQSAQPPAAPAAAAPKTKKQPDEITIYSHSNLFYWWPVWLCGFIVAVVTYFQGYVMAIVPAKNVNAAVNATVTVETATKKPEPMPNQVVVWAPQSEDPNHVGVGIQDNNEARAPSLRVLPHRIGGVIFVFILLMVVFITNVPLRGMWSLLVIVLAVALVIIFIALGWIETVVTWFALLDVRINMAGYMTVAVFLFIIWLLAVLIFDRQRYITFTPGQFRVCEQIGGGEQVYSTEGISFQKQRSDFFRHYILGLGSGDLIVRTAGAQLHHIDLSNVLFIHYKVKQIEDLIARRMVVETK